MLQQRISHSIYIFMLANLDGKVYHQQVWYNWQVTAKTSPHPKFEFSREL